MKVRGFWSWLVFAAVFLSSIHGQRQWSRQSLIRHVRPAISLGQAKVVGVLQSTRRLDQAIVLPLRNQAGLTSLLSRLYDPSSPDYRHFLSVAEFTEQFAPTPEDYRAVVDFAEANGFTVTGSPANRLVVPISGTVEQAQRAFYVTMKVYRHPTEERDFYSPDREPSLELKTPVAHIAGLNNYSIPHPMFEKRANARTAIGTSVLGSGPRGSYLGSDMRAAYYGGTALTGTGQVVGLMEFDGYNFGDVDLTFSNAGQSWSVPVNNVLLDGANGGACQYISPCSDAEEVLDIVQAIGMAPGLSLVRVYIGSSDANIFNTMASEDIARQLSVSWTWVPEDVSTDDIFFQEFAAQGQSVFVASGDYGAYDPSIDYYFPAEEAWVTAAGGTNLVTNGARGKWSSETAWS